MSKYIFGLCASILAITAQAQSTFKDCADCPTMVAIPAGAFDMGATADENVREGSPDRYIAWESPVHRVTLPRPPAVSATEVTRGQFAAFVRATGHPIGGCDVARGDDWDRRTDKSWLDPDFEQDDSHPVVCVDWNDAKAYVRWLSDRTGRSYRLLSEAEWEYVARARTTTARFWGNDRERACRHANVPDASTGRRENVFPCDDGFAFTAPAGSFAPNAFGLFDTIGNVWEWVEDCFHDSYAGAPADGTPRMSEAPCPHHVARGGSWNPRLASQLRSAARGRVTTTLRNSNLGFRVAASPVAPGAGIRVSSVTSSDGVVLSVSESGPREAPAVLFLHGIGQSRTSWRRQLESPLAQRLRLVAMDLRGHGDSGKPAIPEAYRRACQWADDVRAVREALGLERPVLVAWSFGGLVAMNYVRCEGAGSLAGLVLVASAGGRLVPTTPTGAAQARLASRDMMASDLRLNLAGARAFARLMTARAPDAAWEHETVAALLQLPAYVRRAMEGGQYGPEGERIADNADLVAQLTLPMLVVTGGRDGLNDGHALAEAYRARFPAARVLEYPESGHSPFAEEAERFNRDLEALVDAARAAPRAGP